MTSNDFEFDCDTAETAIHSLSVLMRTSAGHIRERLSEWPLKEFDDFAQKRGFGGYDDARELLWQRVFGAAMPCSPKIIHWFHATRVIPDTNFSEGLLPLPEAVALLTERLERIVGLRPAPPSRRGFHGEAHREKLEHRASWGPHGHLVREAAFAPEQNHFFYAPEVVVDLGFDITAFRAATVPCIVKFRVREADDHVAAQALYFAYLWAWGQKAAQDCSWTWSGNGRRVPPEDLVRIDFLGDADIFGADADDGCGSCADSAASE